MTKIQSHVILVLNNIRMVPLNVMFWFRVYSKLLTSEYHIPKKRGKIELSTMSIIIIKVTYTNINNNKKVTHTK